MIDALMAVSLAQSVTASAVSTNTIDLGPSGFADDRRLEAQITVDQTVTAAGAATVTFQIIGSASANLSSPTVLKATDAIGKAELTAGRKPIILTLPQRWNGLSAAPRYLGLQYTVGTGPLTAGQFTANFTETPQDMNKIYPVGFAVS